MDNVGDACIIPACVGKGRNNYQSIFYIAMTDEEKNETPSDEENGSDTDEGADEGEGDEEGENEGE